MSNPHVPKLQLTMFPWSTHNFPMVNSQFSHGSRILKHVRATFLMVNPQFFPVNSPCFPPLCASASARSCTKSSRRCLQASPPESLGPERSAVNPQRTRSEPAANPHQGKICGDFRENGNQWWFSTIKHGLIIKPIQSIFFTWFDHQTLVNHPFRKWGNLWWWILVSMEVSINRNEWWLNPWGNLWLILVNGEE